MSGVSHSSSLLRNCTQSNPYSLVLDFRLPWEFDQDRHVSEVVYNLQKNSEDSVSFVNGTRLFNSFQWKNSGKKDKVDKVVPSLRFNLRPFSRGIFCCACPVNFTLIRETAGMHLHRFPSRESRKKRSSKIRRKKQWFEYLRQLFFSFFLL